jgi:hypothetical protein
MNGTAARGPVRLLGRCSVARGKFHRCARFYGLAESPPMNAAFHIDLMTVNFGRPRIFSFRDKALLWITRAGLNSSRWSYAARRAG